jgi:hypothetical protein
MTASTQPATQQATPVTQQAPQPIQVITPFGVQQRMSWLIHGRSKRGKSTLASSAPKPLLVLDAEGSWRFIPPGEGKVIKYWDPLRETPPVYDGTWEICVVHVQEWNTVDLVYKYLTQWPLPFVSVIVDSITEIQRRCFLPDTEVLTPSGWVAITDVREGDAIAQYHADDERITFAATTDVQSFDYSGDVVRTQTNFADLAVTPDHRMLVRNTKQHVPYERTACQLLGGTYYLPVAGRYHGGSADTPTDDEIRLLVALQADSYHATTNVYAFNLRRDRKKTRLERLCQATGTRYRRIDRGDGWTHFRVWRTAVIDKWLPEKTFQWIMLDWSEHGRTVFLDELASWDGSRAPRSVHYGTINDQNADIVSAVAALTGRGSSDMIGRTRIGTPYHRMTVSDYTWRRVGRSDFTTSEKYVGRVHCVTVPSGFIITRRNGKVTIAGNCKSNLKGTDAMKIQDWGVLLSVMDATIRGFRDLCLMPQLNVRCVVFVAETKDGPLGRLIPAMQGQIAGSLPYWVDVCGFLYEDYELDENQQATREVRRLWISPHQMYEAGERVQGRLGKVLTVAKPPDGQVGVEINYWMHFVFGIPWNQQAS